MIILQFKVDPEYLKYETEVIDPVRIKIKNPRSELFSMYLGQSGLIMAEAGATFIFTKKLADIFIKHGVAELTD